MFDSAPPNLPVENNTAQPVPLAPPVPSGPAASKVVSMTGKKEPEDIFAGMNEGGGAAPVPVVPMAVEPVGKSPVKMILVIGGMVALVAAIGGILYYVLVIRPTMQENAALPTANIAVPVKSETAGQIVEKPPVQDEAVQNVGAGAASAPALEPASPQTVPPAGTNIPTPQTTPDVGTSTTAATTEGVSTTTPVVQAAKPSAPLAVTEGADADRDGLTNVEEALYGTSPTVADTDGDGFFDGAEVRGFFNPTAKGTSITASSFIQIMKWHEASFLAPQSWTFAPSTDPAVVRIALNDGGTIQLQVLPNSSHATVADFVASRARSNGLKSFKTKNGLDAVQLSNGLTTYVSQGDTIWVMTYELGESNKIEYRTSFDLVVNSLRALAK